MKINLIGQRFGRLIITSEAEQHGNHRRWHCQCDCGQERVVSMSNLKSRKQQSCGCLRDEQTKARFTTNDFTKCAAFSNWHAIIARCERPHATAYHRYGGRGITICECIQCSPYNLLFVAGDKPSPKHTIERMDTDAHYSCGFCQQCQRMGWKKNVTWATRHEQSLNRCDTVNLTFNGETKCLKEWATIAGVSGPGFKARLKAGRDPFKKMDRRASDRP